MDHPQTEPLPELAMEPSATLESNALQDALEALLLAADQPLPLERLMMVFPERERPDKKALRAALDALRESYADRVAEVLEVGSGWRIQVRERFAPYIAQLWEEKPPRYSRALLETLALIAYRQPITRGEVEEIRGVTLSPSIIKTLLEREWVKVLGVREVPGRPELLGTTRQFLDDFNLQSLESMPTLPEIRDLDALASALEKLQPQEVASTQQPSDGEPAADVIPAQAGIQDEN